MPKPKWAWKIQNSNAGLKIFEAGFFIKLFPYLCRPKFLLTIPVYTGN